MHDAYNPPSFRAGLWEEYQYIQLLKNPGGTNRRWMLTLAEWTASFRAPMVRLRRVAAMTER